MQELQELQELRACEPEDPQQEQETQQRQENPRDSAFASRVVGATQACMALTQKVLMNNNNNNNNQWALLMHFKEHGLRFVILSKVI